MAAVLGHHKPCLKKLCRNTNIKTVADNIDCEITSRSNTLSGLYCRPILEWLIKASNFSIYCENW